MGCLSRFERLRRPCTDIATGPAPRPDVVACWATEGELLPLPTIAQAMTPAATASATTAPRRKRGWRTSSPALPDSLGGSVLALNSSCIPIVSPVCAGNPATHGAPRRRGYLTCERG